MSSSSSIPNSPPPAAHTFIAGEEEYRLERAAAHMGLEQGRMPKKSWAALLYNDLSARMHSVGYVGNDERVDEYGTLHSLRRRKKRQPQEYDQLADLFSAPSSSSPSRTRPQRQTVTDLFQAPSEESGGQTELVTDDSSEEVIDMVEGGSLGAAAFGIVKGIVGPAILYLPSGFYKSGWAVSIPCMLFATGMFVYNAYRLLECWKVESDRNHKVESRLKEVQALLQHADEKKMNHKNNMNGNIYNNNYNNHLESGEQPPPPPPPQQQQYGATVVQQDSLFQAKLLTYPELAKRAFGPYSIFVDLGISLMQFGVCLTYLIFVPDNLYQCGKALLGIHSFSKLTFLWIMIVIEIPISWIRDIRKLTTTNVIASLLIAFGLLAVLGMAFFQGLQTVVVDEATGESELAFVQNMQTLKPATPLWFPIIGTSFFMMEGSIALIVPLQQAVYRPEDQAKFPDLYRTCAFYIVLCYISFSLVTCAAFGSHIKTALTASLTGPLATIVQLAYSIAVILTFPLQAFPAMEVAIPLLFRMTTTAPSGPVAPTVTPLQRNLYATAIVVALGLVAMVSINYLGNIVSLVGSFFGIPLGLVFPPLIHNQLVKDSTPATKLKNYCVALIGFVAMSLASVNTLLTWDQGAES